MEYATLEIYKTLLDSQKLLIDNYKVSLDIRIDLIHDLRKQNTDLHNKKVILDSNAEYYIEKLPNVKYEMQEIMDAVDEIKGDISENKYLTLTNKLKEVYELIDELKDFFESSF